MDGGHPVLQPMVAAFGLVPVVNLPSHASEPTTLRNSSSVKARRVSLRT
jgi:hypothetical protein